MIDYKTLLTYGDFIPLKPRCSVNKLFDEIKIFDFAQYNPRKDIKRYGLSITSLRGEVNGIDLDSLLEIWKETGKMYTESDFSTFTAVYNASSEIQNLIEPFKDHIARSHILNLKPGGYFPPHRDTTVIKEPDDFRVIVPLKRCNPPDMYFMYEDKSLHFDHGRAYFLNTNKTHSVFSLNDSYFIVLNIKNNEDSIKAIGEHFLHI
tara:strand:+ start:135 stop:752 length:618 start_codon:yes stop_codon:yes gene_type:complete